MSQEQGSDPSPEAGDEMSADQVSDLTFDLLLDLYDDQLLNDSLGKLSTGQVADAMADLETGLSERLLDSSDPEWKGFVQLCLAHPIRQLLHQDPFTRRAFEKPRGYPGDPELMDFVYGVDDEQAPPDGTSELGCQIFRYTTRTSLCEDLRFRARLIAGIIDDLAEDADGPEILSVAAGHLQEARLSAAVQQRRIGRWVAFDSDTESLAEIRRLFGEDGIETLAGTVRRLVAGKLQPGEFDLIYSTGLFGYLEQPVGKRLTKQLFDMLRPGGQLLVVSFLSGVAGRGYMESFMDWHLNYRSRDEMLDLGGDIDEAAMSDQRLLTEDSANVAVLRITKK